MKNKENSLVIFAEASKMLARADTIQKTKELKDLALTAADWARRKGMGEEAILYARGWALEALRKMGQLLYDSRDKRAKGAANGTPGPGRGKNAVTQCNRVLSEPTLAEMGITKRESYEAQRLADLPDEKFEEIKNGKISIIAGLKKEIAHVGYSSGENEWYTPEYLIEAARNTMGEIDCDPASSEQANKIVKAKKIYTKETNGLDKKWGKRVWTNPPYAQPLISQFSDAIVEKIKSGEVGEACVLVNNATDTEWLQNILTICDMVCFLKRRVKFIDADGNASGAPLQGQVVVYIGANKKPFQKNFSEYGTILYREI